MASKIQRELALLVTGKDVSASRTLKNVNKNLGNLEKHASKAGRNIARNIERGLIVAGAAAVGAVGYSVKAAGDFEAQLNTINTVAQETPERLAAIGDQIRSLSRDTGTTTDDLTSAYYDLVSAGIKTADAQSVLTEANKLAIGGLSTTAEAVDLLTTAINAYGGDASKAREFTDMFAQAIGSGKVTAAELASSFATVGPMAAQFGVGVDQIAAALGIMTAKGTPAAEAFTQMRSAMVALDKPTAKLRNLQKKLGVDFAKIAREKGLAFAYTEIGKAADKAGIPMVQLTGRIEGAQFAAQVAGSEYEAYAAELERVRDSSQGAGVAQTQMEQRQKGLNFQVARLKANLHDAAITIGTELIPEFAALAGEGTDWLRSHQPEIKQFAKDLAAGVRETVKWMKSLDWDAIGGALRAGATFGKTLVEAFVNAPPWVQQFLAGGFVANKFTGGVLGDIAGELGKGLIKGVLGMNAGVVNINAGVVNGGGMGAAGAAGGMGLKGLLLKAGLLAGGGMLLSQSNAGTQGAMGLGGNVAGGALAGAAFGPLGALVGGLAGSVKSVAEGQSAMTARMAANIKSGLDQSIAGKSLPELRTALAGVDAGIDRITANPLMTFLHGDALATLQQMRDQLATQIANQPKSGGMSPDERQATRDAAKAKDIERLRVAAVKTKDDTVFAIQTAKAASKADATLLAAEQRRVGSEQRRAIDYGALRAVAAARDTEYATRVAGMNEISALRSQTAAIVSALRANRANVTVSPTTINRITVRQSQTGYTDDSRWDKGN